MGKHLFSSLLIAFICTMTVNAVPALSIKRQIIQPDGTTLSVYLRGDEFMNYYETVDGLLLQQNSTGFYCYAELTGEGMIDASPFVARDQVSRSLKENIYIKGIEQESLRSVLAKDWTIRKSERQNIAASPGSIDKEFPTIGDIKGLVILVQFQDIKLSEAATVEVYKRVMNEENYNGSLAYGSVRDYFISQSNGQLKLDFDVAGPVTLSNRCAYYGSSKDLGRERVDEMMMEAVKLAKEANPELDFSQYDKNDDGIVDFVYVIYAGYGQAQGGPEETVWPQSATLEYKDWTVYDGLYLGRYSCSCELKGNTGSDLDGIGTFCHEFGHILGLPDIYDSRFGSCPGMENWDVMDHGSYNDGSKTPAGYTAMDKYTLGWLTPELLDGPQSVSLEALSSSNKAYFLVSETNPNEYYTFENRQQIGWDKALPGHGLLICHIEYDKTIWKTNQVNTNGYEHVALVAADKSKDRVNESSDMRDVFPGSTNSTAFTDNTSPAMIWNSGVKVGKPITNIREEDGNIYFEFMDSSGIQLNKETSDFTVYSDGMSIVVLNDLQADVAIYSLIGRLVYTSRDANCRAQVGEGCYLVRVGSKTCKVNVK